MRRRDSILVLSGLATLKIERGRLVIRHKPEGEPVEHRFDIDDEPPASILFDGRGEWLSGEALRWCARRGVSIVIPDGPGRLITFIQSALEAESSPSARSGGAAEIADIDPATLKRQCVAALDPARSLSIAKAIVVAKIEAETRSVSGRPAIGAIKSRLGESGGYGHSGLVEWRAKIEAARSLGALLIVEARASAAYWRAFREIGLREAKGGDLPRSWLRFANRNRGAQFLGNKHAGHPINAMLNYCYVAEAGRIAKGLSARGLALGLGFLHADKHGRNSLVWDGIEPLRPAIDARVFAFIAGREFRRSDFKPATPGILRLDRRLVAELLASARLPQHEIDRACDFVLDLVSDISDSGGSP
jgi:CRISPR-associated endonuclease Cas1